MHCCYCTAAPLTRMPARHHQEWTSRDKWLGGVVRGGDAVYSAPELTQKMKALGFSMVEESDMPFVIREHGAHEWMFLSRTPERYLIWTAPLDHLSAQVPVGMQPRDSVAAQRRDRIRTHDAVACCVGLCVNCATVQSTPPIPRHVLRCPAPWRA
jgi:hypothetical protein